MPLDDNCLKSVSFIIKFKFKTSINTTHFVVNLLYDVINKTENIQRLENGQCSTIFRLCKYKCNC